MVYDVIAGEKSETQTTCGMQDMGYNVPENACVLDADPRINITYKLAYNIKKINEKYNLSKINTLWGKWKSHYGGGG